MENPPTQDTKKIQVGLLDGKMLIYQENEAIYIRYTKKNQDILIACITDDEITRDPSTTYHIADEPGKITSTIPTEIVETVQEAIKEMGLLPKTHATKQKLIDTLIKTFPIFAPQYKEKIDIEIYADMLQNYKKENEYIIEHIKECYNQYDQAETEKGELTSVIKDLASEIKLGKRRLLQAERELTVEDREKINTANEFNIINKEINQLKKIIGKVKNNTQEKNEILTRLAQQEYKMGQIDSLSDTQKRRLSQTNIKKINIKKTNLQNSIAENEKTLNETTQSLKTLASKREKFFRDFLGYLPEDLQTQWNSLHTQVNNFSSEELEIRVMNKQIDAINNQLKLIGYDIQKIEKEIDQQQNEKAGYQKNIKRSNNNINNNQADKNRVLQLKNNIKDIEAKKKYFLENNTIKELSKRLATIQKQYTNLIEQRNNIETQRDTIKELIDQSWLSYKKICNTITKEITYYSSINTDGLSDEEKQNIRNTIKTSEDKLELNKKDKKEIEFNIQQNKGEIAYSANELSKKWSDTLLPYGMELYTAWSDSESESNEFNPNEIGGKKFKSYRNKVKDLLWLDYINDVNDFKTFVFEYQEHLHHSNIKEFDDIHEIFKRTLEDEKVLKTLKQAKEVKVAGEIRVQQGIGDKEGEQIANNLQTQYNTLEKEIYNLELEKRFLSMLEAEYKHRIKNQKKRIERKKKREEKERKANEKKWRLSKDLPPHSKN